MYKNLNFGLLRFFLFLKTYRTQAFSKPFSSPGFTPHLNLFQNYSYVSEIKTNKQQSHKFSNSVSCNHATDVHPLRRYEKPRRNVQGVVKKNTPLQKSHYFQNNLIFFGELFRDYLRDILQLVLLILAFLLQFYRNGRGLNIKDDFLK